MKVIYDPSKDMMRIIFRDMPFEDYNEEQPNIKVHYDVDDQLVAIDIQHASELIDDPHSVDHQILEI